MDETKLNNIGKYLKEARLSKNMTLVEFYGAVTKHVSNLSSVENGNRKIGKRLLKDIIKHHSINTKWLEKGEEPIFSNNKPYLKEGEKSSKTSNYSTVRKEEVPYYNIQLTDMTFDGPDVFQEMPEFYVNFRPFNDCTAYLPIYGDSMYPRFASGEIIAIKEVVNHEVIQWGEAYLVVTNELANNMVTVKLLYEHDDKNKLILRASNPSFKGDTVIDRHAIVKLFIVKGKITRNQL
ncbi:XRE family transcriptional regulator [Olivibacter domesticus]|uniref:Phage repressor protein C, contains Cro/C1-type HTH and peptisase s24 domains n=1 Tax=Olivibacter domesticus TaxID=407022 RepID=A0A1H7YJK9_OLID1|nr:S24 family peptidase [Olivibacter domesticus]SEM46014.1 Phage repressor protein C, contains Cro/C1-type HTH and peptisase s24 domains [Olivibacter domesticus]